MPRKNHRLVAKQLRRHCDPKQFKFISLNKYHFFLARLTFHGNSQKSSGGMKIALLYTLD